MTSTGQPVSFLCVLLLVGLCNNINPHLYQSPKRHFRCGKSGVGNSEDLLGGESCCLPSQRSSLVSHSRVRTDAVMCRVFNWIIWALVGASADITHWRLIWAATTGRWNPTLHVASTFRAGNAGWRVQKCEQTQQQSHKGHLNWPSSASAGGMEWEGLARNHSNRLCFYFILMECIFSRYENISYTEIRNQTVAIKDGAITVCKWW